MISVGALRTWGVAVDLLQVGLPVNFVMSVVGTTSPKKLRALRNEVWTDKLGGCCPMSLDRQMGSHRRRLEASLFLGIYTICGGEETFRNVDPHAFVAALRWYWRLRRKHCLEGVEVIDARAGWLLVRGLRAGEIVERDCPVCGTVYSHFVRGTKLGTCPVCAIEQDWRMQRPGRQVAVIDVGEGGRAHAVG